VPVSPLSGNFVNTRTPTLTWVLPTGFTEAHVEVCYDRACTDPVYSADVTGTSTTVPLASELPNGIVFWRVSTDEGATPTPSTLTSAVWEMELPGGAVGAHNATRTTWWGVVPDFNGDGFADFITEANVSGPGGGQYLYVYPGGQNALGTAVAISKGGFGGPSTSAPPIGDFNGDGFVDLIGGTNGGSCGNCLDVYNGGPTGLSATPTDSVSLSTFTGGQQGYAVGDINGDGYADLIVLSNTQPDADNNQYIQLTAFLGAATGLSVVPTTVTTTIISNFQGEASTVDAADVNGDGFADVLVYNTTPPGSSTNLSMGLVFYGGASGITATAVTLTETTQNGRGGIAAAGDVNGDGFVDVLVGANNGINVYLGGSPNIATTSAVTLPVGAGFSDFTVPAAGDLNGDGYADVVLLGTTAPYVAIFKGSATGLGVTPTSYAPPPPTGYTLANGANSFNNPLTGTGDINGDGFPDLGISVQWQNASGNSYETYVFLGGSPLPTTPWSGGSALPGGEINLVR